MTKFFFIISVFALISCSQQKGKQNKTETNRKEQSPGITTITFNEEIHNFGFLKSGEIVVSSFVFTNTGEHNLIIKNVDSDCGCIHIKFPRQPVKPNETDKIEVTFNSSGMFGKQFKTIDLYANCKEPKHLAIFADIKNEQLEIKY